MHIKNRKARKWRDCANNIGEDSECLPVWHFLQTHLISAEKCNEH